MKLSEHFSEDELRCHCKEKGLPSPPYCGGTLGPGIHPRLIEKLEELRERIRKPIIVLSGYRCPEYNRHPSVGGEPHSQHLLGTAADITVAGMLPDTLAKHAETIGFGGLGVYPTKGFVHVDVRRKKARWRG